MRNHSRSLTFIGITAATLLVMTGCATSTTEANDDELEPITLRLAHCVAETHPYHAASESFAAEISAASDSRVTVEIFPNCELGDEASLIDLMGTNDVDIVISYAGSAAGTTPGLGFISIPYLFDSPEHWQRVFEDRATLDVVNDVIAASNNAYTAEGVGTFGARSMFTKSLVPESVADLSGLKIRVPQSDTLVESWTAIGTLPIAVPFNELYSALETGLVDAAENAPVGYEVGSFYEVAPNFIQTEHEVGTVFFLLRSSAIEGVDDATVTLIKDSLFEAGKEISRISIADNERLLEELPAKGAQIYEVESDLRSELQALVAPVIEAYTVSLNMQAFADVVASAR